MVHLTDMRVNYLYNERTIPYTASCQEGDHMSNIKLTNNLAQKRELFWQYDTIMGTAL